VTIRSALTVGAVCCGALAGACSSEESDSTRGAGVGSMSSNAGSSSNTAGTGNDGDATLRSYQGTAAVGDFINIVIDPEAGTLSYDNVTNGQSGVASFTVAADGSYDIDDPNGNILSAIELPGYALVMDMDHAGPNSDTRSFAFGIQRAPISIDSFGIDAGVVMQFRTNSGGMQVGCVTLDFPTSITMDEYWPFGALNDQGLAYRHEQAPIAGIEEDPSGYFLRAAQPEGGYSYVFQTPSGIAAIDNPNGNMIIFQQPDSAAFDATWAGEYTSLIYRKDDAGRGGTAPDGGPAPETGVPSIDKHSVTVGGDGSFVLADSAGAVTVSGSLAPAAEILIGPNMLTGPCNGLFGFSALETGQAREVFVAFIDRAMLIASFRPNDDGSYGYFYGAGLRRATSE
jgi:hypothetical protein